VNKRTSIVAGVAAVASIAGLGLVQPASAATGLTLTVNHPYVRVGTVGSWVNACTLTGWSTAPSILTYTASSPAGIASYDVSYNSGFSPPVTTHYTTNTPAKWTADNYFGDCGGQGGPGSGGWIVVAHDKAGHSITKQENYTLTVVRWNNSVTGGLGPNPGSWGFSGGWKSTTCPCADGGSQVNNTKAGAFALYTAHVSVAGEHRDLEMATGPGRGKAAIYLDGVLKKTIDTHAAVNGNQVYVWDSGALAKGTHTIKVVNLATAGHPRIDINAMTDFN